MNQTHKFSRIATLSVVLLFYGCSTGYMSPAHPYDFILGSSDKDLQASIISLADLKSIWADYDNAKDAEERFRLRNKIVSRLRVPIDELWRRYMSSFYGNEALAKTTFEGTSTTLSAAAAITTPPGAASILSALSAAISGIGASAEKNFLQQQSVILIFHQMEADVQLYGGKLDLGMLAPDKDYPLAVALSDLDQYARSMSVPHAISSINAATGAQSQAVKQGTINAVNAQTVPKAPNAP